MAQTQFEFKGPQGWLALGAVAAWALTTARARATIAEAARFWCFVWPRWGRALIPICTQPSKRN